MSTVDYYQKMKDAAKQEEEYHRVKYRRSGMRHLQFKIHQWTPTYATMGWTEGGPKLTLLELCRQHAGVEGGDDPRYHRIKESYLSGMAAREAIEAELDAST